MFSSYHVPTIIYAAYFFFIFFYSSTYVQLFTSVWTVSYDTVQILTIQHSLVTSTKVLMLHTSYEQ